MAESKDYDYGKLIEECSLISDKMLKLATTYGGGSGDVVRDLYCVKMLVDTHIGDKMKELRLKEKSDNPISHPSL